jgi:cytochrome b561
MGDGAFDVEAQKDISPPPPDTPGRQKWCTCSAGHIAFYMLIAALVFLGAISLYWDIRDSDANGRGKASAYVLFPPLPL